jgi:hypothetical protein
MMTTVELPYEIWLHIFRLLTPETIRQLRFINAMFYNLSLDELYRTTQIGHSFTRFAHPPLRCVSSGNTLDLTHSNSS